MDSNAAQFSREDDKERQLVSAEPAAEELGPARGTSPQAAGEAGPGCQSTTQGSSSQPLRMEGYPDYLISGDIDWFEWCALIDFSDSAIFQNICEEFQRVKDKCQTDRRDFEEIILEGFGRVRVGRTGINRGGARGQHFEFQINVPGVTFGLSPRNVDDAIEGRGGHQVNFYSLQRGRDCLLVGAREGYRRAMEFIDFLCGEPADLKISRADLALDICNLDTAELTKLVLADHFVTLANNIRPEMNLVSKKQMGFSAGKSPMRLSVYDKYAERLGKADDLYNQALIDRRWYGEMPRFATRVEYQMRRRWLLSQGIHSPMDFLGTCGSLCQKGTCEWFRITTDPVDRDNKHQSRSEVHPIWHGIQRGFETVFGEPEVSLRPISRQKISATKLLEQARGCLASALLQMDKKCETYGQFAEASKRAIVAMASGKDAKEAFMTQLKKRKMEFETT